MLRWLFILLLPISHIAQVITFDDLEYCTLHTYEEDKVFLEEKGFKFQNESRGPIGIEAKFLLTGKDSAGIKLLTNNVKVWYVDAQLKKEKDVLAIKKKAAERGYMLEKGQSKSDKAETYHKGESFFRFEIKSNQLLGKYFDVTYFNEH
jgi:hypothetical protein